jgi:imidazolonepropionase-like amidohydrolase
VKEGEVPHGVRVMDLSDYDVSPPFHDHHLHFFRSSLAKADRIGKDLKRYGVLSVTESGDREETGIAMKDRLAGNVGVRTAGIAIYKTGGYGCYLGKGVDNVKAAHEQIDELISKGVDFIKIVNSGIFEPVSGTITVGGFKMHELRDIIHYVHDRGLNVTCHANGDERISDAVKAGASAIVHGFHISGDTLYMMKEKATAFIPTIHALRCLKKRAASGGGRNVDRMVDEHLAAVKKASDIGVNVLAGSDSGPDFIPYGSSFSEELALFREAGLSHAEILSAAVVGPLKSGDEVQFVVLNGLDPLRTITDNEGLFSG